MRRLVSSNSGLSRVSAVTERRRSMRRFRRRGRDNGIKVLVDLNKSTIEQE
jgi:hypothetical protein